MIPKVSNPATHFDLGAPAPRRTIWTAEDEAAFIAAAYDLGLPSMALAVELAIYTAQREGDLIAFSEPQFCELEIFDPLLHERLAGEDGRVMGWELAQQKTGHILAIPLEPKIAARVAAAIRYNRARDRTAGRLMTHVLVNDRTGEPWKRRHFITTWRAILTHAAEHANRPGMSELVWHDLRRTRVVRLRRRSMPKEMIASITGHSLKAIEDMLRVYGPIDATVTAAAIAGSLEPSNISPKIR